jgi:hypothetical protein
MNILTNTQLINQKKKGHDADRHFSAHSIVIIVPTSRTRNSSLSEEYTRDTFQAKLGVSF